MASYTYPGYAFDRRGEKIFAGIAHESVGGDNWNAKQTTDYFAANAKTDEPGSYHYAIMANGFILAIVPETMASASTGYGVVPGWNSWNPNATPKPRPNRNLNWGSINICLMTPEIMGANWTYPVEQIDMLDKLCREIQYRYPGIRWFTHNECDTEAVKQGMPAGQAHHDPRNFNADQWRARIKAAPMPPPTPTGPFGFVLGFADYAKAHPEIGAALEDEHTVNGVAYQRTEKGVLVYTAKDGVRYAKWQ